MRKVWLAGVVALSAVLPATSASAWWWDEVKGNDTGGIVPWSCENERDAVRIAADYCAGWRKYGRVTSIHRQPGDYIAFNCLWSPDRARSTLPEVRPARSVCASPQVRWFPWLPWL